MTKRTYGGKGNFQKLTPKQIQFLENLRKTKEEGTKQEGGK